MLESGLDLSGLELCSVEGCFELCNEPSGFPEWWRVY
jgi:hypothetical protein